jgi:hypothetical protein
MAHGLDEIFGNKNVAKNTLMSLVLLAEVVLQNCPLASHT